MLLFHKFNSLAVLYCASCEEEEKAMNVDKSECVGDDVPEKHCETISQIGIYGSCTYIKERNRNSFQYIFILHTKQSLFGIG